MTANWNNQLRTLVQSTGFALHEAVLHLDTHPEDSQALAYYEQAADAYRYAVQSYERACGPLYAADAAKNESWAWTALPWPWEKEANE